jgi:hypothetical protein
VRAGILTIAAVIALSSGVAACGGAPLPPREAVFAAPGRSPIEQATEQLARAQRPGKEARVRIALASDGAAASALTAAGVTLDARPESFAILPSAGETLVVGRDEVGALYGAMEIAERLAGDEPPLTALLAAAPAVPLRAANLFLVLPRDLKAPDPSWWFRSEEFWREYLDLLVRARINFLDIHGMYNPTTTTCPNALLYFATSATYPQIGAAPAEREANARMLARVVELAKERGIRVGLMSYSSTTSLAGSNEPSLLGESDLATYTREAARDLVTRVPGLWRVGFRIGESGHPARWYADTFAAGVREAGGRVGLSTRTWLTKKAEILDLVRASGADLLVEAKYNGEQLGPPYPIAGGLVTWNESHFTSYSYEDYLDQPAPYSFAFHIWSGGTNRVFRFASYDRIRRTVLTTTWGGARGFSLMPPHAFYPQRDFWHREAADRFSPWSFRRDELEILMFGRLGYDPATPERVFRAALRRRAGSDALWDALQAASEIPAWIVTANACGPDQRQSAPELEWGGSVAMWAGETRTSAVRRFCHTSYHGPLDTFAIASPHEAAADLAEGRGTSKMSPLDVARVVLDTARRARAAATVAVDPANAEARDIQREAVALADLGDFFAHKLRAAAALAVFERTGREDYLAAARAEIGVAHEAWGALVQHCGYIAPFEEWMRMSRVGYRGDYHWSMQRLDEDLAALDAAARAQKRRPPAPATLPPASAWLASSRGPGPGLAALDVTVPDAGRFHVSVRFAAPVPAGASVRVLHKAFSGLADWEAIPATGSGAAFSADVPRRDASGFFAVEIVGGAGVGWRYPDPVRETPYKLVEGR